MGSGFKGSEVQPSSRRSGAMTRREGGRFRGSEGSEVTKKGSSVMNSPHGSKSIGLLMPGHDMRVHDKPEHGMQEHGMRVHDTTAHDNLRHKIHVFPLF